MSDNPTLPAATTPATSEAAPVASAPVAAPVVAPVSDAAPAALLTPEPSAAPVAAPTEPAKEPATAPAVEPAATEPVAVAAPTYTDFTFPEGVKASPAVMAEVTKMFGEHKLPQEAAQKLIDTHFAEVQKAVQATADNAVNTWSQKSKDWYKEVETDPEIGGNRFETSLNLARGVWPEVLPNEVDRQRLIADLTATQIVNHPVLTRAMVEVGRRMQEVLRLTGTTKWDDAMKKLREPTPPLPGQPARAGSNGARPADRRYASTQRA